MPTYDLDRLDVLPLRAMQAARDGMDEASGRATGIAVNAAREVMQGASGATFASTIVFTATADDDGAAAFDDAYLQAAARLQNFRGHEGKAYAEIGDLVPPWTVRAILTTPVDYAEAQELDGRRSFRGDAWVLGAPVLFQGAVLGLKDLFGG